MPVIIKDKESVIEGIKAIGETLITKAEEIGEDVERDKVVSITIKSELKVGEICTLEIRKDSLVMKDN